MLEFQSIKAFLLKDILQIGQKKLLPLAKFKKQFPGHMLLTISAVKKLLEHFMKEKVIKRKGYDKSFNSSIDKKRYCIN